MKKYILPLLCLSFPYLSQAKVPIDSVVSICSPYPEINDPTSFPQKFNTTNNLARPSDSAFYEAEGEKITIYGRIMDGNCTPLSDAKIYIWQANKKGYVQYPIKTPNDRKHHKAWIDPNFTGTGTINSDNMGRFNFSTIKPGSPTKVTPHIHIMVEHPKLKTLNSKIYFVKEGVSKIIDTNKDDNVFILKDKNLIAQVTAVKGTHPNNYMIDITMDGTIDHKGF